MFYDSDNDSISSAPIITNTLLGYVDVEISDNEPLYSNDSFIGGQPIWMDKYSPIPSKYVHCKNCQKPMRLLTQCFAELPNTWYDRSLYVFICIETNCRRKEGSVRTIRGVKKDKDIMEKRENDEKKRIEEEKLRKEEKIKKEEETKNLVKDLFGTSNTIDSINPFASSSTNNNPFSNNNNPFETKKIENEINKISESKTISTGASNKDILQPIETIKKNEDNKKIPEYKLSEFKGFILYFEIEKLDPANQVLAPLPDNLKIDEEGTIIEDNSSANNVQSGNLPKINPEKNKETEDLSKLFDDQTFQNFTRILSYNTQQVIRYEPDGSPILYSSKDKISKIFYTPEGKFKNKVEWNIPSPSYNPSGSRRFEMQLMPKMIIDLESDVDDINKIMKNGMEWGTIIIATDSEDFVPLNWFDKHGVAYVEEWCGVQWEDEVHK